MNGGDQVVIKNKITHSISKYLSSENLELYDLNIAGDQMITKIEIFIFSEEEQSIKTFERLSFQIHRLLDELGVEKGSFELIISSPGIERSLKTTRHFELALNEEIKIKLFNPKDGEYTFIGNLIKIDNEKIEITQDGLSHFFELENIKKANISFNKFKEKIKSWGINEIR